MFFYQNNLAYLGVFGSIHVRDVDKSLDSRFSSKFGKTPSAVHMDIVKIEVTEKKSIQVLEWGGRGGGGAESLQQFFLEFSSKTWQGKFHFWGREVDQLTYSFFS